MPSISPTHISSASLDSIDVPENNGINRKVMLGDANDLYGVSRHDSFSNNSTVDKDLASRQVVKALRSFVSGKSHTKMIHNGTLWKDVPAHAEKSHIDSLSKSNLHSLRKELGSLAVEEKGFLERFFETPLFATHSTAAPVKREDDSVALFSRQKLIDRNIIFNTESSPQEDIKLLGNDDFVFFALEAGIQPKKPSSRFGGTTFRFDFDEPVFKDAAWLSLVEMRFAKTPNLDRHVEGLSVEEYNALSKRTLQPFQTVFSGGDMKAGIGLSIIRDLRRLPPESGRRLLGSTGEHQINKLVNGMYRPEIKVARHFFSDKYIEAAVKKDDKS